MKAGTSGCALNGGVFAACFAAWALSGERQASRPATRASFGQRLPVATDAGESLFQINYLRVGVSLSRRVHSFSLFSCSAVPVP
jgi:hypothetical protein